MVNPTFKKITGGGTAGTSAKYGGQDIVKMADILDGTHATERIQLHTMEGIERYSLPRFLYMIRQVGGEQPNATYQTIDGSTLQVIDTDEEFRVLFNRLMASLPDNEQSAMQQPPPPLGVILLQGSQLDCETGTANINRNVIVDGLGSAVVRKTGAYTGIRTSVLNIARSNVTIRNLTVEDVIQAQGDGTPQDPVFLAKGIKADPPFSIKNILVENVRVKNMNHHGVNFGATRPRLIENLILRNVFIDKTNHGAGIVIGMGCKNTTIENCYVKNSGHSGMDIWGLEPHTKIIGNLLEKHDPGGVNPGPCIACVTYADHQVNEGKAEDIIIRDNRIITDRVTPRWTVGIKVHAESKKVEIVNNFVDGVSQFGIHVSSDEMPTGEVHFGHEVLILGNVVSHVGQIGIQLNQDSQEFPGLSVIGNYIHDIQRNGIALTGNIHNGIITDNQIYRYGLDSEADRTGIRLRLASTNKNVVTGNVIMAPAGATHSIWEESSTDSNIIADNIIVNEDKPITFIGANSIVAGNIGYKTENSGTASITSGNTSVNVTHGLGSGYTPSLQHIQVTPASSMGSASRFWISSPTSNQFTINVNTDPGQTVTFAWQIARTPPSS